MDPRRVRDQPHRSSEPRVAHVRRVVVQPERLQVRDVGPLHQRRTTQLWMPRRPQVTGLNYALLSTPAQLETSLPLWESLSVRRSPAAGDSPLDDSVPTPGDRFIADSMSAVEGGLPSELPADRAAAVTQLFDAHYVPLVRMARLLVDDVESAEDVVMDGFAALHRRWSAIRDSEQAYRYVRSSVLNGARSQLRRRRTSRQHAVELIDLPATGDDLALRRTEHAVVMGVLRSLPTRQRQVLVLRYFLDLSEAEISAELGISCGSVKTHASRGLAAARRALKETQ